jgi:hypothetical protein
MLTRALLPETKFQSAPDLPCTTKLAFIIMLDQVSTSAEYLNHCYSM